MSNNRDIVAAIDCLIIFRIREALSSHVNSKMQKVQEYEESAEETKLILQTLLEEKAGVTSNE